MKTWLVWDTAWGREAGVYVFAWTRKGAVRKVRRSVGSLGVMRAEEDDRG